MNQAQRKFLIDKIELKAKNQIEELKRRLPKYPVLKNHLAHAILSGTIEYKSIENIAETVRQRALSTDKSDELLDDGWGSSTKIKFEVGDIFIMPPEYQKALDNYRKVRGEISGEISEIEKTSEALVMRIQLASDKTLQTLVNEVDDMGNLSLFDTTIKALTGGK